MSKGSSLCIVVREKSLENILRALITHGQLAVVVLWIFMRVVSMSFNTRAW